VTSDALSDARAVLSGEWPGLRSAWQRTVVFLARQALEDTVSGTLRVRAPGAERVSARARLLCLATFVPDDLAHDATFLWSVLSRACHHHAYELAPTWGELDDWLTQAERVCANLDNLAAPS
jgi:hypothetical protein